MFAEWLIEVCPKLEVIIIDDNLIETLDEILPLKWLKMKEISFVGNPLGNIASSRSMILEFMFFNGFQIPDYVPKWYI